MLLSPPCPHLLSPSYSSLSLCSSSMFQAQSCPRAFALTVAFTWMLSPRYPPDFLISSNCKFGVFQAPWDLEMREDKPEIAERQH